MPINKEHDHSQKTRKSSQIELSIQKPKDADSSIDNFDTSPALVDRLETSKIESESNW